MMTRRPYLLSRRSAINVGPYVSMKPALNAEMVDADVERLCASACAFPPPCPAPLLPSMP